MQYACYRAGPATTYILDRALLLICLDSVIRIVRRPVAGWSVFRLPAAAVDISPLQNALSGVSSKGATRPKGCGVFFTENKQAADEGEF